MNASNPASSPNPSARPPAPGEQAGSKLDTVKELWNNYIWKYLSPVVPVLWRPVEIIFLSSIRVKLTLFIGALIFISILISSLFNVNQQSEILSDSYEREAAISKTYISSLVLDLDAIAASLIQVEEFRSRVKTQKRALSRYRQTRSYQKDESVSVFGIKTNLFGALGKKRVYYKTDSYFSKYLTEKDISKLEDATRRRLEIVKRGSIADGDFKRLQLLARRFVGINNVYEDRQKDLEQLEDQIKGYEATPNKDEALKEEIKQLQTRLTLERQKTSQSALLARKARINLDSALTALLTTSIRDRIRELGLDLNRFRIQSFAVNAIVAGQDASPTLDTRLFDDTSKLNKELKNDRLRKHLEITVGQMIAEISSRSEYATLGLVMDGLNLQAYYTPHFRNPASTSRALLIKKLRSSDHPWQAYLQEEAQFNHKIKLLQPKIKARLEELKNKRPPLPPFRDREFINNYREYNKLVQQRRKLFDAQLELVKEDSRYNEQTADAIAYAREASLAELVLTRYESSSGLQERYASNAIERKRLQNRWLALRHWVYAGRSETPPASLKNQFYDGMIIRSRSEAEEIMWQLDRKAIAGKSNHDVAAFILENNFAGVMRTFINRTDGLLAIRENRDRTLWTSAIVLGVAMLLAILVSGFVVGKIKRIIRSAEAVGEGDLNIEFEHGGADEFGNLTVALNSMVGGLREREKIKGILGSMIDPVVVGEAMKDMDALKRGSEKNITAFFSDIAGFSTISEQLTSVQLAAVLNEYLSAMTLILKEHHGVLDKYIGDAIVGIFNAPVDVKDYTAQAVRASLRMIERLEELRTNWKANNHYTPEVQNMQFRIGLHTGPAKVGFMGTDALAAYTMMGDTVNLAARLEAAGKDYGVSILTTEAVFHQVHEFVLARKLDLIRVKGKTEPVIIYEIISDRPDVPENIRESVKLYEEGLDFYLERKWSEALKKFKASEAARGTPDKAARMLIGRIEEYKDKQPRANWDGVFTREHK